MPVAHIDSYYAASANPAPNRPPLTGDVQADVCVVGGGIAGCATALFLAERGYRVVLLEGNRIAFGASGRSGGQAIVGYACSQDKLAAQVSRADAKKMFDISVDALDLIKVLVERHRIDCDLHWGHLHTAIKPRQEADLRAYQEELVNEYGYTSTRWLDQAELGAVLNTDRYIGGLRDDRSGHLHPLNYTLGLAAAAEAAGVQIHEQAMVVGIEHGSTVRVRTIAGPSVRARHVALCCNAFIDEMISKALRDRIMPVGTYIIATERLGQVRIESLLRENVAVSDVNFVLDYFRRSDDHRLLFGGRVSYSGRDALNTANATRARMLKVFPSLADAKTDFAWGGHVDITMSRAPDFGRIAPNVYYLQGFSGHGIALTGIAGQMVAETIAGQAERFDLFTKLRHRDFPGGPALRTPALMLAMLWFRLKDLL
ncbi:MAG: FAD-binding oxidoreductase [Steroidobacteraceae bacterium]|nr:FAD-binding oxidoreductase [Steroidobacteraceae bacterium]MBP7012806.1 FAD-binding oxidoreductase [Steroidobacteraceae bacterium]